MGVLHRAAKLVLRKIGWGGTHAERGAGQIDGVGPILQRRVQTFPVAGRRQQFRSVHVVPPYRTNEAMPYFFNKWPCGIPQGHFN